VAGNPNAFTTGKTSCALIGVEWVVASYAQNTIAGYFNDVPALHSVQHYPSWVISLDNKVSSKTIRYHEFDAIWLTRAAMAPRYHKGDYDKIGAIESRRPHR
jgi:hypothetical protein